MNAETTLFVEELKPIVSRAAAKMSKKYALRLSRRRVVCAEDLAGIGWVQVLSKLERISQIPAGAERSKFVYTLVCHAVHSEMQYIATGFDDAASLTSAGALTGAKDNSYDGAGDEFAPTDVQPASEFWAVPELWDDWSKMDLERRRELLEHAGLKGATALQKDGPRVSYASAKWSEIPWDDQISIEKIWKQKVKGELRKNKHANAAKPRNVFGFVSNALPAPDELATITPQKLRAVAMLVHSGGFHSDGDSINSGKIAKILGRSARSIHRDNTELLKLWGAYSRAPLDKKRDEKLFPRYPLHTAVADGFAQIPDGAQMPVPSNPVLESVMMTPGRLRSLRHRMEKFHTDFSDAVVTATIVRPRANIYECGPRPSVFKIIAGFKDSIAASDGHSQTIDAQWDYRDKRWVPVRLATGEKCKRGVSQRWNLSTDVKVPRQPYVWGHDWSDTAIADEMGNAPTRLYLTTQRQTVNPMYPREAEDRNPVWCNCPLCQTMRKLDSLGMDYADAASRATFGNVKPYSTIEDRPLRRSPLRVGIMHGFDTVVGEARIRKTHFISAAGGVELWTVEDFGHAREVLTGQTGNFLTFPIFNPESVRLFLPATPAPMRPWLPAVGSLPSWGDAPWLVDNVQAKLLLDGTLTTRAAHKGNPWLEVILVEYMSAEEIANVWYKKRRYWLDRIKAVRADAAHSKKIRYDFEHSIFELWETTTAKLILEGAKMDEASETECSAFELQIKT